MSDSLSVEREHTPADARRNSIELLARGERSTFGQLSVAREPDGWRVAGPATDAHSATDLPADADTVRAHVRFDESGRYRPLTGALTLPGGWACCVDESSGPALAVEIIETVYPLAVHHRDAWQRGDLPVIPLDDVLSRQSGRYGIAGQLSEQGRSAAGEVLCGRCVRVPVWRGDRPDREAIPCPEPCGVLVSLCREAAVWESEGAPEPAAPDSAVAWAAFEEPGNEVREAYLAARYTIPEVS